MWNFFKKNTKWIILIIIIIFLIFIIKDVFSKQIIKYDISIYKYIANYINDNNTTIAKIITNLGSSLVLIAITLFSIAFLKNKRYGTLMAINLCAIVLINNLLKIIIQRNRPIEFPLINEVGYSFPSGHSMVSMAFYGLIIYLLYKKLNNKIKWFVIIVLSVLIIFIGLSRIYLGVHYPSDVIGGFLISVAYLIVFINILIKKKYII